MARQRILHWQAIKKYIFQKGKIGNQIEDTLRDWDWDIERALN